ncbi:MAG: ADP-ribosylation factor-like protein [Candidatus Lokiarchaeota archaeon]|nr:ADP-ribosylation factor-like protein [Candidatus Lokiarchaeota archaeon]
MRTTCLGYNFMKVLNLKPTKSISRENFIFRGIMEINLWDAGGQSHYIERYFSESHRELVFSEVTTAVFMVDSTVVEDRIKEVFDKFLTYIFEFSPHIDKVYVLLNKIDLQESEEDKIYELLTNGMSDELKDRLAFTPVSVKEGSAQHRLIEILDYEIQQNTLSLQRLGKIRHLLDELKVNTLSEYLLFNQPDGLLIASTMGKFESKPLQFLKFEIGTLDSNVYQIYSKIMDLLNSDVSPLDLSTVIYESEEKYVLIKEMSNNTVLMAVTKSKNEEAFVTIMKTLRGDDFNRLKQYLSNVNF